MNDIDFNKLALKVWTSIIMFDERNKITAPTQKEIERVIKEFFENA